MTFRTSLFAAALLATCATAATAEDATRYAQAGLNDYCITCWAEPVAQNAKRTCWDVQATNQLAARIRGDFICLGNFGTPQYGFGRGSCKSKNYCKTIKR